MEELIFKYFPNLNTAQKEQFKLLSPLYKDWNSKINLISRTDIDNLYEHHVLHSLAIAKFFEDEGLVQLPKTQAGQPQLVENKKTFKIMDVGTGGGFPGVPLAIMYPHIKFLLVDSTGKKIMVASEVCKSLGLTNVTAIKARAEELDLSEFYDGSPECDYIVSRAVAALDKFIPWVKGKYAKGIIYLKGGDTSEGGDLDKEIRSAAKQNGILRETVGITEITKWFPTPYFEGKKVLFFPRKQKMLPHR
jgi:16S rRNA (guanine527-N7)-methyltransferase